MGENRFSRWILGPRPPLAASVALCVVLVGLVAAMRFWVFPNRVAPVAMVVPLLLHVWTRSRRLLWSMAAALIAVSAIKVFWLLPMRAPGHGYDWPAWVLLSANAVLVAAAVHLIILLWQGLEKRNAALAQANEELEASNEELAAREEEIGRQNEELQTQTEELEQQTEELREQAEELRQQGEELQQSNSELERRELAMQTLLRTAGWLMGERAEGRIMSRVCQAAVEAMADGAVAALIVQPEGAGMRVGGHWGFGEAGPIKQAWGLDRALGWLVMQRDRTARLDDASLRPDLEMPQPSGGPRLRSMLATPLRMRGRVIGALEVLSDEAREWTDQDFRVIEWLSAQAGLLLEAVSLQGELDLRRREAEEASMRKTRFLAAVSHDVRTPANAISLMAELICRSASEASTLGEVPGLARDLQSSARALVDLVSDVLDLARFDSGARDLLVSDFDLCAVARAEARQVAPLAAAKGLSLKACESEGGFWLRTDRMKVARIIANLLGNAIKFTEAGEVSIRCGRGEDGDARIEVTDTGIGIPPGHCEEIFDEFLQLRNPERDRSKGTGLGLAICRRLADALGGSLTVRSEPGHGSAFTLSLPASLGIAAPERAACDGPTEAGRPLTSLRILLVEDHDVTRRATARLLAMEGGIVMQAATGREALHLLTHDDPQVVLLDLMLPDMDGCEILRKLHRRPRSLQCVLAVSGDVTEARRREVVALGADGLVPKPVDVPSLVRLIRRQAPREAGEPACSDRAS